MVLRYKEKRKNRNFEKTICYVGFCFYLVYGQSELVMNIWVTYDAKLEVDDANFKDLMKTEDANDTLSQLYATILKWNGFKSYEGSGSQSTIHKARSKPKDEPDEFVTDAMKF
ncbi:hypothetical protein L2E82_39359 [Cichorium intybus]|uniref:Uncharacterized protein n=1 Tax=Cichorium intybus TaxID=13427 RepID=A0ACB9AJQ9_CICIN|nr:hypothetical protein L2E82_39359 [Cichorium intybus]